MLNWIWLSFLVISVLVAGFSGRLPEMTNGAFEQAQEAVMKVALPLMGVWAIWLGMMRLAEQSGLVQLLARALRPIMRRLFPDVPPEHPAMGAMVLNMAANMLGLGNAATPLGLRAMAHLERLNPNPGVASNAMCTFLAINTASIQLVPTSAISILAINHSANPTAIVPSAFLATCCAAMAGVLSAKLLERLPMFRIRPASREASASTIPEPVVGDLLEAEKVTVPPMRRWGFFVLAVYFLLFAVLLALLIAPEQIGHLVAPTFKSWNDWLFGPHLEPGHGFALPPQPEALAGKAGGVRGLFSIAILAVPFLLSFFPLYAAVRGVRVYEQFVEGAKEAFDTAKRVIPFLVAMLVSIKMLREAGVISLLQSGLAPVLKKLTEWVGVTDFQPAELLPLVLMRPLSGSATNGIFVELVKSLGPDSFTSRVAATIFGSTETTFYVIAVYFGAVAIRQTRHAIAAGLIADTTAVVASVFFCRLLFA